MTAPAQAEQLSLEPKAWSIQHSQGLPPHPGSEGAGWSFDFPQGTVCDQKYNCAGVHYITIPYSKLIATTSTLIVKFHIVTRGPVKFNSRLEASNTCLSPATIRVFLQRADDDLYAANGRFWSNPIATTLRPGSFTMAVRFQPDQWTNVEGQHDPRGFEALLSKIGYVGITFGGGCFFGHGVNVEGGSARFLMSSFAIN